MKTFNVYFLYNSAKELLYVGKSISLKNRLIAHFSKAAIEQDQWKTEVDQENIIIHHCENDCDLDIYETYFINKYKPKHNKDKVFTSSTTFELPYLEPETYNFLKERKSSFKVPYQESLKKVVAILSKEILSEEDTEYLEATYLLEPSIKLAVDILGVKRINTLRYHKAKITQEIEYKSPKTIEFIKQEINKQFNKNTFYSTKECKEKLLNIDKQLNISRVVSGIDILDYVSGKVVNKRLEGVLTQGVILT